MNQRSDDATRISQQPRLSKISENSSKNDKVCHSKTQGVISLRDESNVHSRAFGSNSRTTYSQFKDSSCPKTPSQSSGFNRDNLRSKQETEFRLIRQDSRLGQ